MLKICITNEVFIEILFSLTYLYNYLVPYRKTHNNLIDSLEKSQKDIKIVGGNTFPMEKGYILLKSPNKSLIEDFVKNVM